MPQLLLELLSEEIPARMQARAAADLQRLLTDTLAEAGFEGDAAHAYAGPRRLTAVVDGLPARSADVREERKGPRVGAPEKAVQGFLRGAGLDSLDACETRSDKKGEYYVAVIERPGRDAAEVIAQAVPEIVRGFPWPKSMRSGSGRMRWVRPLQRIVCLFDGEVVPFEIEGVASGNETEGHRLMGRGPFAVKNFADYAKTLKAKGHVLIDPAERKTLIAEQAKAVCAKAGLELVEDEGLLQEVTGLAEWPVVLLGDMNPDFLDLPPEVIRLSMRVHQKYFAVRDPKSGTLAPHFVVVANQDAPDGGKAIAAGNARVLSARLSDARHFWDNDRATLLGANIPKLRDIVFHAKLGSVFDKTARVEALARELAPMVGADPDLAGVAAKLAKADLVSEMVYEFPELQGVMGRYYALQEAGLDPLTGKGKVKPDVGYDAKAARVVADAIRDHYRPQGPSDEVPTEPVSIAVALADKFDTLAGFWLIDEKPTGSKDPFALRRAALGSIRLVLNNKVRVRLQPLFCSLIWGGIADFLKVLIDQETEEMESLAAKLQSFGVSVTIGDKGYHLQPAGVELHRDAFVSRYGDVPTERADDLLAFFADRLKVHLRDEGHRHDLVDAVFALGEDDLVLIVKRVEALGSFLDSDDGANLLAGWKRASNIVRDEEKKGFNVDKARQELAGRAKKFETVMDKISAGLVEAPERDLHRALLSARKEAAAAVAKEDFAAAMAALAPLRAVVDRFFDEVTVNAEDSALRRNRLLLLSQFRDAVAGVADFSKIEA